MSHQAVASAMSMSRKNLLVKVSFMPEEEEIRAEAPGGRKISLSISKNGFTPLELALIALGACAAIEAYKLLSIRGGFVKRVNADVSFDEEKDRINLNFQIKADRIGKKEAEEIITRSLERYCSVWLTIKQSTGLDIKVKLSKT